MRVMLNGEEQEIRDDITVAELLRSADYLAVWCGGGESSGGAEKGS